MGAFVSNFSKISDLQYFPIHKTFIFLLTEAKQATLRKLQDNQLYQSDDNIQGRVEMLLVTIHKKLGISARLKGYWACHVIH